MEQAYQCQICTKKFPAIAPYGGRIPQRENLKPSCNIIIHNFNVGLLGKRCFKCDEKIVNKMEKILNKDRNKIDLSERKFNKDMFDPFETYDEWKKRMTIERSKGKHVCTKCKKGYDDLKYTFSKNVRILAGSYAILETDNTCTECIKEITKELKELLK